ncbi:MAG: hypothetical protein Q7S43_01620 [bacterium]|nr:hypothetical protein [bacterium]
MEIVGLVCLGLGAIIFIVLAVSNSDVFMRVIASLIVLCFFMIFAIVAGEVLKDGSPVLDIKAGQYKVAFVYQAGGNVSIGIELIDIHKQERLYCYQFKGEVFDGQIRTEATILTVIESGDFKKLKLE